MEKWYYKRNKAMNPEAIKKLSEDVKARIAATLASKEMQEFLTKVKAAGDTGTFEVIISTSDIDRSGESIVQEGMDLANYKQNPIVLWAHDYYALPIGIAESIEIAEGKLIAKGRFAPEDANPFAQQVRRLYDAGIVRATSVGFIVREMQGNVITKAELLEFSFVPVPANPHALSLSEAKALGIDIDMLAIKGLKLETKNDEPPADPQPTPEPAPETPPAEPTPEPAPAPEEQKGQVSDEMNAEAMWEQKWAKLDAMLDIVDAFLNVYLDEKTPVEQFTPLLNETVALLSNLAGGTAAAEGILQKAIETRKAADPKTLKRFVLRAKAVKTIEAVGAEIAAMQAECDTSMSAHSMKIIEICREAGMPETGEKKNDGSPPEGGAAEGEVTPQGVSPKKVEDPRASIGEEFNDFVAVRSLVRSAATAMGLALERMNDRAREHAGKTR